MAGSFPEGSEFNVNQDAKASAFVFQNWPTPILFSGVEIGMKIMTGHKVTTQGTKGSPVQWAYGYCLSICKTSSPSIVTHGIIRLSYVRCVILKIFYVIGNGTFVCNLGRVQIMEC